MAFFIYLNGEKRGPFAEDRIQQWLEAGLLRPGDLAATHIDGELKPLAALRTSTDEATHLSPTPRSAVAEEPSRLFTPDAQASTSLPTVAREALGPYARATLAPNETAYLRTSLHWIIFARFAFLGLVLFLFVALPFAVAVQALAGSQLGWFVLPFPVFVLLPPTIAFASSELVVTNMRVLIKTGVVRRQTLEMFISKIESIAVDQGFLGRLLGYGTVMIRGTGGFQEPFESIARPIELRNCVQRLQTAPPTPHAQVS